MPKYVIIALNGPTPEGDPEVLERWYEEVHMPDLLSVDGIHTARRFKTLRGRVLGHEELWPRVAIYEIETDDLAAVSVGMQQQCRPFHPIFDRSKSAHIFAELTAEQSETPPAASAAAARDLAGYQGRRVLVSGCASGMGRATAKLLLEAGAEVHGLDVRPGDLPLASMGQVDLRDPASIDAAVGGLSGAFDALFNCAGLGPTFSPLDIVKVNFIGTRHLTERVLPMLKSGGAIGSIASTAGMGWSRRVPVLKEFIAAQDYSAAVRWAEAHPDVVGEGYSFSKEAVVVWTMLQSQELIGRGIRINCTMPGLTQTPMLTDQIAVNTAAEVLDQVVQPFGRAATPEEQAFPLVMITSPAAGYLNGAALNVDGGRMAGLTMRG